MNKVTNKCLKHFLTIQKAKRTLTNLKMNSAQDKKKA